jgi:hypothetical protein
MLVGAVRAPDNIDEVPEGLRAELNAVSNRTVQIDEPIG